jgi:hypothetical protein
MTREQQLAHIWNTTHPDFRGTWQGEPYILVDRGAKGTCIVTLQKLTDEEIKSRL